MSDTGTISKHLDNLLLLVGKISPEKTENGLVTFKEGDVISLNRQFMYLWEVLKSAEVYSQCPVSGITPGKISKRTNLREAIESFNLFFNDDIPF